MGSESRGLGVDSSGRSALGLDTEKIACWISLMGHMTEAIMLGPCHSHGVDRKDRCC